MADGKPETDEAAPQVEAVAATTEVTTEAQEKEEELAKEDSKKSSKRKKKEAKAKEKKVEKPKKARPRRPGDIILKNQAAIDLLIKYQMGQPELKKFKTSFIEIDEDGSGMIDFEEFFSTIEEPRSNFIDGLFSLVDQDGNRTLDFEEYVIAVTSYCMRTRDEILKFAYDTFDVDGSGSIDEDEFKRLCTVVNNGKPTFPGNFARAITEFDRNGDGLIDFDEFKTLNRRYPLLLFPCFRLQDKLQKKTLGEKHWHILHKRYYIQLKLQIYKRKHNGAEPPVSIMKKIKRFLGIGVIDVYQP